MPSPMPSDRYVNPLLTNVAIKFMQESRAFISTRLFPNVAVNLQGGQYAVYERGDFFRDPGIATRRGLSEESKGTKFHTRLAQYYCFPYALHKDVDKQEYANQQSPFDAERDATEIVAEQLQIRREREFIDRYFKEDVWGIDLVGVSGTPSTGQFTQWDQDGSDPVQDISNLRVAMGRTGYVPNRLAVDFATHEALVNNAAVKDRIKFGGTPDRPAIVNERALAQLFGVDEYVVGRAVYTITEDGAEEQETDYIMPHGALLTYAPSRPSLQRPSAGFVFSWRGFAPGGNEFGIAVDKFPMRHLNSNRIEAEMAYDMHIAAPDLGAFLSGTISSN